MTIGTLRGTRRDVLWRSPRVEVLSCGHSGPPKNRHPARYRYCIKCSEILDAQAGQTCRSYYLAPLEDGRVLIVDKDGYLNRSDNYEHMRERAERWFLVWAPSLEEAISALKKDEVIAQWGMIYGKQLMLPTSRSAHRSKFISMTAWRQKRGPKTPTRTGRGSRSRRGRSRP